LSWPWLGMAVWQVRCSCGNSEPSAAVLLACLIACVAYSHGLDARQPRRCVRVVRRNTCLACTSLTEHPQMRQRRQLPPSSPEIAVYAQGPTCCAVCAPRRASQSAIELEIVRRIPGGSNTGWTVSVGPFPDGLPNPRTCPSDPHRQHWLLVRGVKRNTTQRKAPAYSS
jgi:hypothetical protein